MDPYYKQLTLMRAALLRAANSRLRNPEWAEDAVSETLLAALQKRPDFVAPGRLRAWLFGILRHKVVDQLRQHLGDDGSLCASDEGEGDISEIRDPCPRADPMNCVMARQFVTALHGQLQRLPQVQADAFYMRECLGSGTEETCEKLAISVGNLCVMVHRTRCRLRRNLADHRA